MQSVGDFARFKAAGRVIAMVTAYDAWSARAAAGSNVDALLVGDSVAMVVHGHPTTLTASVEMLALHTRAVVRAAGGKLVVADLPFLSYRKGLSVAIYGTGTEGTFQDYRFECDRPTIAIPVVEFGVFDPTPRSPGVVPSLYPLPWLPPIVAMKVVTCLPPTAAPPRVAAAASFREPPRAAECPRTPSSRASTRAARSGSPPECPTTKTRRRRWGTPK